MVSLISWAVRSSHNVRSGERTLPNRDTAMKLCYCDESGTGDEPIAVMAGIVVDATRMHITKEHWIKLLKRLSSIAGKELTELHTRDFYAGRGIWKAMNGASRAAFITEVFEWIVERKHPVVYASVNKNSYKNNFNAGTIPDELGTPWRFLGMHMILSIQRCHQKEDRPRGHTIFIFDNEEQEKMRFKDIIMRPPKWSDEYYSLGHKDEPLNQIVDVPYFGDSKEVALIQVADVVCYFLRRYAEIKDGLVPPKYSDEEKRVEGWVRTLSSRCIGGAHIYPKIGRNESQSMFFDNASPAIRSL
jgi:Protein of unknown function (DUF3800)